MNDMKVEKLKRKVRKMTWHQRIELMDWMNTWYSAMKEEEEIMMAEEEDPCICIPDEPNVNCRWCY